MSSVTIVASSSKEKKETRRARKPYARKPKQKKEDETHIELAVLGRIPRRVPKVPYSALANDILNRKNMRDCLLIQCKRFHPNIKPRHDFDILVLTTQGYSQNADEDKFYEWSDRAMDQQIPGGMFHPLEKPDDAAKQRYIQGLGTFMEGPPDATGLKPVESEPDMHIRPLPNCGFSLRLWGRFLEEKREYCLDFIDKTTSEPVNTPKGYELWTVPNKRAPWLPSGNMKLESMEQIIGYDPEQIPPGEEKYQLLEGTPCRLIRPGSKSVYFEVPIRSRPAEDIDEEEWDFPFNLLQKEKETRRTRKPYERKEKQTQTDSTKYMNHRMLGRVPRRVPKVPYSALANDVLNRKNMRDCLRIQCKRFHPDIILLHDWDIVVLTMRGFRQDMQQEQFYEWADKVIEEEIPPAMFHGEKHPSDAVKQKYIEGFRDFMEGPPSATGIKPVAGEPDLHIRAIPDSNYSLRMWGRFLETNHQYCLDFFDNVSCEPVNVPDGYELWRTQWKVSESPVVPAWRRGVFGAVPITITGPPSERSDTEAPNSIKVLYVQSTTHSQFYIRGNRSHAIYIEVNTICEKEEVRRKSKPYERKQSKRKTKVDDSKYVCVGAFGMLARRKARVPYSALATEILNRKNTRDCLLILCKRYYPGIEPRHDFDIWALTQKRFNEDDNRFYAWADKDLDDQIVWVQHEGRDRDAVRREFIEGFRDFMEGPPILKGIKPAPGEDDVHIQRLPDCRYSVRLWGRFMEADREYCLDFIDNTTGEPVNVPEGYELWTVPYKRAPWIPSGNVRLSTVERSFGSNPEDISPDEEKYILLEGTACRLVRPGLKNIYFEVPVRERPLEEVDEIEISFSSRKPS
ncbi:hypothetical protein EIP91_007656 [Steccherinum ochraceum]|uniref:Uncharacterized protein n=1 Tax=Steccherinum ochraceum TaxID=92696 RepID=A0A4R0R3Y8_9APHY|nr:hypothetical protein EIP91_007656 [Steccherinum ochraceum]